MPKSMCFLLENSNLIVHFPWLIAVPALRQFLVFLQHLAAFHQEFSRFGGYNRIWWDRLKHKCHRAYLATSANGNGAENGCSYANGDVVLDGRVTFLETTRAAPPPAGCAEGHLVIEHQIIADDRGFPNHDTCSVVNEEAFADLRAGMYFDTTCYEAGEL